MDFYKVHIKKSAEKELLKIPGSDLKKITGKIAALSHNPRPPGSEKLSGDDRYRLRQGDWRIVYGIDDQMKTVLVIKIGHRKKDYR